MILISQEEKEKNLEFLKQTVSELYHNSRCLKCYKKYNYLKQDSNYYKNPDDVPYLTRFSGLGIYVYIGHTPCNSLITIRTDANYSIQELYINYDFYKKPYHLVSVNNIMIKDENDKR